MRRALRRRLAGAGVGGEAGLTLIELLVAATMSVVLVGAATAMLISAVRDQPALSKKAQNVTTARWQLERVVREIRNGISVKEATPAKVSLIVRRASCAGTVSSDGESPVECQVTYTCGTGSCLRTEAVPGSAPVSPATVALSGISNAAVFCFAPSTGTEPSECGSAASESPAYVGVNLEVPNPNGPGLLTISDGANLRSASFISQ